MDRALSMHMLALFLHRRYRNCDAGDFRTKQLMCPEGPSEITAVVILATIGTQYHFTNGGRLAACTWSGAESAKLRAERPCGATSQKGEF